MVPPEDERYKVLDATISDVYADRVYALITAYFVLVLATNLVTIGKSTTRLWQRMRTTNDHLYPSPHHRSTDMARADRPPALRTRRGSRPLYCTPDGRANDDSIGGLVFPHDLCCPGHPCCSL